MSISSICCHRTGRQDRASRTDWARSAASRRSSTSGSSAATPSSATSSWASTTRLRAARLRRHSLRAVAASQEPTRSGCSMRLMCSSSRIHVTWATSAASLSGSLKSLVMAQMSLEYWSTRRSHAHRSPTAARRTSCATSNASEPSCLVVIQSPVVSRHQRISARGSKEPGLVKGYRVGTCCRPSGDGPDMLEQQVPEQLKPHLYLWLVSQNERQHAESPHPVQLLRETSLSA